MELVSYFTIRRGDVINCVFESSLKSRLLRERKDHCFVLIRVGDMELLSAAFYFFFHCVWNGYLNLITGIGIMDSLVSELL